MWSRVNIGRGMLKGSVSYKKGTFSQTGSGSLGIKRDQLSYNYQTLTGDGEIKAMVSSLQNTGGQSNVGVMIRGSLAANAAYSFMGLSGGNTYRTESRLTAGGSATGATKGKGTLPNTWVKLTRVGSVITAFKSSDGTTWTAVGSKNIEMAATCYIGLTVSSGTGTSLNRSQFKNVSVTP